MSRSRAALFFSFLVNYLDLSGSRAFGLLLCALRILSRLLDEGKRFVHDWCVVHMGGQRAGGAGGWTPGGRGALRPVEHSRCRRSLGSFAAAPAQCPLSPETSIHQKVSHHLFDITCT